MSHTYLNDQCLGGDRRHSGLPILALIWSLLASPVGLFWPALFLPVWGPWPSRLELNLLVWAFLVVLPITSFCVSASVWCHLDRNADRLKGRVLATVAWIISSLSLVVGLLLALGTLTC